MKAVLLVGGEGTRLRPLTLGCPKPLQPVANRPFLEHVLASLARHGVDEVILTTGYLAEAFDALQPEQLHGVKLTVVREETLLDTCGAVKNVEHLLDGTFLVLNGDVLTDLDVTAMLAQHRQRRAMATIALARVEDPSAYGLVPVDAEGRIERFVEKPRDDEIVTNLINAGTYVLEPEALDRVPAGRRWSFERALFPDLLADGAAVYGFESNAYWLDMGTPARYLQANRDVLEGKVGEIPPGRQTPSGAWVCEGARIDPSVRVRGPVAIGAGCRVELGSVIYPGTSLGSGCRIGKGVTIEESMLHDDVEVADGASIQRTILGSGVKVGSRTRLVDAVVGRDVTIGTDNELRAGIRLFPPLEIPDGAIRF